MAIDEFQTHKISHLLAELCHFKIPDHAQDKVKLDFQVLSNSVTLFENRKHFRNESIWVKVNIAQFRYDPSDGMWTLYWWRHTGKWFVYEISKHTADIATLVIEVKSDPTGIFWG